MESGRGLELARRSLELAWNHLERLGASWRGWRVEGPLSQFSPVLHRPSSPSFRFPNGRGRMAGMEIRDWKVVLAFNFLIFRKFEQNAG